MLGPDETLQLSGSTLPVRTTYISAENSLQVRFRTDRSVTRRGFSSTFIGKQRLAQENNLLKKNCYDVIC